MVWQNRWQRRCNRGEGAVEVAERVAKEKQRGGGEERRKAGEEKEEEQQTIQIRK